MLSKLQKFKEEREQGFTLIELLIVILIIGILSAIAIPAFLNQRKAAVDSSVQSDVANAAKQIESKLSKNWNQTIESRIVTGSEASASPYAFISAAALVLSLDDAKVSPGNVLLVRGTNKAGEYCIIGASASGDLSAATGVTYDSTGGGINRDGGACADTDTVSGSSATAIQPTFVNDVTEGKYKTSDSGDESGETEGSYMQVDSGSGAIDDGHTFEPLGWKLERSKLGEGDYKYRITLDQPLTTPVNYQTFDSQESPNGHESIFDISFSNGSLTFNNEFSDLTVDRMGGFDLWELDDGRKFHL